MVLSKTQSDPDEEIWLFLANQLAPERYKYVGSKSCWPSLHHSIWSKTHTNAQEQTVPDMDKAGLHNIMFRYILKTVMSMKSYGQNQLG